jgi:UTP--glucose-1-phosphate uridylyltransferase
LNKNLLDILIDKGYDYIFVSNSDNLGAVVSPVILNKMIEDKIDFVMEVCIRTDNDKKGGHLASTKKGKLILRETAQCPDDEVEEFQDIKKYKYFNTNNLWINLHALKEKIKEHNGLLPLDLIINEKKVDGEAVYQLETAMGAAISLFDNSKAIIVPRDRFVPVKKNQDLLMLWSDVFSLNEMHVLEKKKGQKEPIISLDDEFYGKIDLLQKACSNGIPSLKNCSSLQIKGNVKFGNNVVFRGNVQIEANKDLLLHDVIIEGRD